MASLGKFLAPKFSAFSTFSEFSVFARLSSERFASSAIWSGILSASSIVANEV
jgi:hypothetical protein